MSQYHPDADPDFVAMHSHYEALSDSQFRQALHTAFDTIAYLTLDSEKSDFCYSLWKQGYKIVPVNAEPVMTTDERPSYLRASVLQPEVVRLPDAT